MVSAVVRPYRVVLHILHRKRTHLQKDSIAGNLPQGVTTFAESNVLVSHAACLFRFACTFFLAPRASSFCGNNSVSPWLEKVAEC